MDIIVKEKGWNEHVLWAAFIEELDEWDATTQPQTNDAGQDEGIMGLPTFMKDLVIATAIKRFLRKRIPLDNVRTVEDVVSLI